MHIFDTVVINAITSFFQSVWIETTGKIFIITFMAYSISYMIYSGYISWFAGGYGGLLLSQVGFTAIDFLTLVPTSLLLMIETIKTFLKFVLKFIFLYIAPPIFLFGVILSVTLNWKTHLLPYSDALSSLALILVFVGGILTFYFSGEEKRTLSRYLYGLTCIAVILVALFIPAPTNIPASNPTSGPQEKVDLLLEFTSILYLVLIVMVPFLAGQWMAQLAVTGKLLSKLTRVTLKQDIPVPGMQKISLGTVDEKPTTQLEKFLILLRPKSKVEPQTFTYGEIPDYPVYLIASFNRITALYISSEILNSNRGKMVILANDIIYSLEVEARKKTV